MVFFKGKWLLYYGTADSKIAVAEASMYDYRGVLDVRAKARKEAANLETELTNPKEEVFRHQQQEMMSKMRQKVSAAERKKAKESESFPENPEADPPKASTPLDHVAEEL